MLTEPPKRQAEVSHTMYRTRQETTTFPHHGQRRTDALSGVDSLHVGQPMGVNGTARERARQRVPFDPDLFDPPLPLPQPPSPPLQPRLYLLALHFTSELI